MKAALLILVVAIIAVAVSCNDEKTQLTVTPNSLPAGGGSVKVEYKTSGYLSTVQFELKSNPQLSGFPIPWSGNMSGSITPTVTKTTTFTISNMPSGTTVTSKTVSVP